MLKKNFSVAPGLQRCDDISLSSHITSPVTTEMFLFLLQPQNLKGILLFVTALFQRLATHTP